MICSVVIWVVIIVVLWLVVGIAEVPITNYMGIVEPTIGADPFAAGSLEEVIGGARVV